MTGGQGALELETRSATRTRERNEFQRGVSGRELSVVVPRGEDKELHRRQLELIDSGSDGRCVWLSDRESDSGSNGGAARPVGSGSRFLR